MRVTFAKLRSPHWCKSQVASTRRWSSVPQETAPAKFYYAVNKPYGMLSQFTSDSPNHTNLKALRIPRNDVYAAGRLDQDSEGLLILSNDARFINKVLGSKTTKEYLAQVDGLINSAHVERLMSKVGIEIKVKDKENKSVLYRCKPALRVEVASPPLVSNFELPENKAHISHRLWPEEHVRRRKNQPTQFLSVALAEGKNRQVRKMLTAVGLPVVRLIRTSVGLLKLLETPELGRPGSLLEIAPEDVLGPSWDMSTDAPKDEIIDFTRRRTNNK